MNEALAAAVEAIAPRFRSGNRIPVDKAQVPAEEWHALVAALASAPAATQGEHKPGCEALGGYGHGIGACDCGAATTPQPTAPARAAEPPRAYAGRERGAWEHGYAAGLATQPAAAELTDTAGVASAARLISSGPNAGRVMQPAVAERFAQELREAVEGGASSSDLMHMLATYQAPATQPAAADTEIRRKAAAYDRLQPYLCKTCGGFGLVDTRSQNDPLGSEPCPDCNAPAPLTAFQLDALIERHVGGTELQDGEYSSMVLFAAAVERAHGIGSATPRSQAPAGVEAAQQGQVAVSLDEAVEYIKRYGGFCRDCADENGVCPSSGLPCSGGDKAIRHVLQALEYGVMNGYIPLAQKSHPPGRRMP